MSVEGALCDRLDPDDRLIETLGYRPGEGAVRAQLHAARMESSATVLGFPFDHKAFNTALARIATGPVPLRVRLTLAIDGNIETQTAPFPLPPDGAEWRVAIAGTRLDSSDPLIRHKTTRRAPYEAARAEFAASVVDEVLLLNERGEVCEGTLTSLFVDTGNGLLKTPPLASGLLAGVLRRHLLDSGQAIERVVMPSDLRTARAIFVGNSLRGLVPVRLRAG